MTPKNVSLSKPYRLFLESPTIENSYKLWKKNSGLGFVEPNPEILLMILNKTLFYKRKR